MQQLYPHAPHSTSFPVFLQEKINNEKISGRYLCYTHPQKGGGAVESFLGHRQRLRDRFARAGFDGFAAHEALELLLTYAIPRRDTKPLAYALIDRFGSLQGVLAATSADLCAVPGIGQSAATLIGMMLPFMRLYQLGAANESPILAAGDGMKRYCRALMLGERYERLWLLALDPAGKLLLKTLISSGDEGETAVYPRLIVAALLRCGAAGAVLCHNHPGMDAAPSQADKDMTRALNALLIPLSIRMLDHIIVADHSIFSFRDNGFM
jgi:DNA repair protein RadC